MEKLLEKLRLDFPQLTFREDKAFCWSPRDNVIAYTLNKRSSRLSTWSLLHEVGHALLNHQAYQSDFELLSLEVAAWGKAQEIGPEYGVRIDPEHIQDCLDTYRDWLHRRSTCPKCDTCSLQQDARTYRCFNCGASWYVSSSRLCRPYRRHAKKNSPAEVVAGEFFVRL